MLNLFFLVRSLDAGGAERQLIELVRRLDRTRFHVTVATFYDGGSLRSEVAAIPDTTVVSLGKRGRWDAAPFLLRLIGAVRAAAPHIVIGYMNVANELALFAGRLAGAKVVWNLRSAYVDFSQYDWLSRWTFRVGAWLSRFPDAILANSAAGSAHHQAEGYRGSVMTVIANGIDTTRFARNVVNARRIRTELGIAEHHRVVGLVARLDPIKDHALFLAAAAQVAAQQPDVHFLCVGEGPRSYREHLAAIADQHGLRGHLTWAGGRPDMAAVYSAVDIGVCCSIGEGFPNVVAEGMAAGVPQVVTDVGDAVAIIGETGEVCLTREPADLAAAILRLLARLDDDLRSRARKRIEDHFSTERLRVTVEDTLVQIAGHQ